MDFSPIASNQVASAVGIAIQQSNINDTAQLREEIRALDLLSRKAYITNQWQVRTD